MALQTVSFKGDIGGKTLGFYKGKLDYSLENLEERIELVRKILRVENIGEIEFMKDDFWIEVFDRGCCKVSINTDDPTYSETNVANFLESLGTYILSKDKNPQKEKIKTYDNYELFTRTIKENQKVSKLGEVNANHNNELEVFVEKGNYRKAIEESITSKDIEQLPYLKDYDDYRKHLTVLYKTKECRDKLIEKISKEINSINNISVPVFVSANIQKNLGLVKTDMIDVKQSVIHPFCAKIETKSVCTPNWDELDMFNTEHVKELIRVKKGNDLQDDLTCIVTDLNKLIKEVELTDKQKEILELWKRGKSQEDIGRVLEISKQMVNKQINSIVNSIISKYEEQYEDWYYLNVVKGKYKKCSKCGDIKILQRFNKNSRRVDGHETFCKKCQRK